MCIRVHLVHNILAKSIKKFSNLKIMYMHPIKLVCILKVALTSRRALVGNGKNQYEKCVQSNVILKD